VRKKARGLKKAATAVSRVLTAQIAFLIRISFFSLFGVGKENND
jgi:hypothetical protein